MTRTSPKTGCREPFHMLGRAKNRAGTPGNGQATLPDVVAPFPRGLPDGNLFRPLGTARWAADAEARALLGEWKPGRFLIGRDASGRYIGHSDDRHILTVAGSRAGKGVSLIVPNLLFWPGSVVAVDPKGELATITASRRADPGPQDASEWSLPLGGEVYALDPFKRVTGPAEAFRAAFNPMAELDPATDEGLELAGQIADALVIQIDGPGSHWTQSARSFLRGLILYVAATEPALSKNLLTVRAKITQDRKSLNLMLADMGSERFADTVIKRAGDSLSAKPASEKWSVISTCDVQTDFLEGEAMRSVLCRSSFKLEDLKERRITVYLCLPATRLGTHGRWLRLIVGMALEAMERTGPIRDGVPPVLFCLDEFAALDHMAAIEKAAGQIAGFGVKLWPVIQDLTQLRRDYKEAWETFMGNAGLLTFFGNTDLTTLEHVAKRLGECEVIRPVANTSESWQRSASTSTPDMIGALMGQGGRSINKGENSAGNRAVNEQLMKAALMNPDEIARHFAREAGNILAFVPDKPPIALNRCAYHSAADDPLFGGLFDPVPGKPLPRTTAEERRRRDASAGKGPR